MALGSVNHLISEYKGRENMSTYTKRTMVTLLPEWEPIFNKLKKEKFYNESKAEMIRYIIGLGLASLEKNQLEEMHSKETDRDTK